MPFRFLDRHLSDGGAHRVFAAQRAFALHGGGEFKELQAQFARYVLRFDVCQVLAPGGAQPVLDGVGTRQEKRGRFESIVDRRHADFFVIARWWPTPGDGPIAPRTSCNAFSCSCNGDPDPSMAYSANIARHLSNATGDLNRTPPCEPEQREGT